MTLRCCICEKHFTPVFPRLNPDFPGYCDECAELEIETRPPSELENKIYGLKIGGSLFFPVTECDPRPWETLRAEIKRSRWAYLGGGLCVHRVQRDDPYIQNDGAAGSESADGARLFKTLTFDDLTLGVDFIMKVTS